MFKSRLGADCSSPPRTKEEIGAEHAAHVEAKKTLRELSESMGENFRIRLLFWGCILGPLIFGNSNLFSKPLGELESFLHRSRQLAVSVCKVIAKPIGGVVRTRL